MAIEPTPQSLAFADEYGEAFRRLRKSFIIRGVPREEASDLAQEAAARLLVHLERNGVDQSHADLTPLLNRIAANLLIDHMRANVRKIVSLDDLEVEVGASDPVDEVMRRQKTSIVRRAIKELPSRQREALVLSLEGHGPTEIAVHLGLQRNAADALLYRARRGLAERLHALRGELHGIALLAGWRIRSFLRRSGNPEGVIAASPAIAGVVSAAIGLALSLPSAPAAAFAAPAPIEVASEQTSVATTAAVPPAHAGVAIGGASGGESARRTHVSVRDHRAGFHTKVKGPDGRETPLGVDIWHERDEDRGTAGPIIDDATEAVCAVSVPCSEPEGDG